MAISISPYMISNSYPIFRCEFQPCQRLTSMHLMCLTTNWRTRMCWSSDPVMMWEKARKRQLPSRMISSGAVRATLAIWSNELYTQSSACVLLPRCIDWVVFVWTGKRLWWRNNFHVTVTIVWTHIDHRRFFSFLIGSIDLDGWEPVLLHRFVETVVIHH